ncbi:LysR family transcriptional regulator [Kibdelosporangium philippinense]|uniref:LysR family transcriptional regulator n=1 Tax=Kibdelosporangium philippinense TaxID=211113 RepID=A0ABS8Z7E6_9PSEU|nr:LysR family transcriptional regulator [Kibdelosporangium philippinense]MCE7003740.1 LysR family transcriptional regulator [Kibdelosporangium philippinense]
MQLDAADLNLLKPLAVLLEERHVSRAAARFHLSTSAMSRSLTRLRDLFQDDLLVQTPTGYELTPRARTIRRELATVLPRLSALIRGDEFDLATATDQFTIHCTDYGTQVLGPRLFRRISQQAPNVSLVVESIGGHTFDDIDHGRADIALVGIKPPAPLRFQLLFEEDYVCVVAADHPVSGDRISMDDLVRYPRISVVPMRLEGMHTEHQLVDLGVTARPTLRVPYFAAAIAALPETSSYTILARRFAELYDDDPAIRVLQAPQEIKPLAFGMVWHPRQNSDPAHTWLRDQIEAVATE